VLSRLYELIKGDPSPVLEIELKAGERDILNFAAPPEWIQKGIIAPQLTFTPPIFINIHKIPKLRKRILFAGNHCIWALDSTLLLYGLITYARIWPRVLGEHAWFAIPGVKEFVQHIGGVIDGTPASCSLVMNSGDNLLVYPGGARESWKCTTDKKYSLMWSRNPTGFARMAIKHNYTIVPVCSVGVEDAWQSFYDFPLGDFMRLLFGAKKKTSKPTPNQAPPSSGTATGGAFSSVAVTGTTNPPSVSTNSAANTSRLQNQVDPTQSKVFKKGIRLPFVRPSHPQRQYFLFGNPLFTSEVERDLYTSGAEEAHSPSKRTTSPSRRKQQQKAKLLQESKLKREEGKKNVYSRQVLSDKDVRNKLGRAESDKLITPNPEVRSQVYRDPDQLREACKLELESGIKWLLKHRDKDPNRYRLGRNYSAM